MCETRVTYVTGMCGMCGTPILRPSVGTQKLSSLYSH